MNIKLKEIAKDLGKNASIISKETGINRNTINSLMRNKNDDVKLSTLEKICNTYKLELNNLVYLNDLNTLAGHKSPNEFKNKLYKQEGEAIPFTCWPWILAAGSYSLILDNRKIGFGYLNAYIVNNYLIAYWDNKSLQELANSFYITYSDKQEHDKLYKKYIYSSAEIEKIYTSIQDGVDISDNIIEFFDKIKAAYKSFWENSLFIDAFDIGVDRTNIEEIAQRYNISKKELEILTTPSEMTFVDERKYALLKLIKKIFNINKTYSQDKIKSILEDNNQEIKNYIQKYDYYKSNYARIDHISFNEIFNEISRFLNNKSDYKAEYKKLSNYSTDKQNEKNIILRKKHLRDNPLWFFDSITFWREHRKRINLMGIFVLDHILNIIEDKTGIQKKYLGCLSFDEVENTLKGLVTIDELKNRFENGLLIAVKGDEYKVFEGHEAKSIYQGLESTLGDSKNEFQIITGNTASQGYAKGIARIILVQGDFAKLKEGEILVTGMTRPEFVPIMKKASAIVTNEGGITCHAAIISRELGKPCIIGTRNATQLIHDGDLIEVRANHGTVRIINKVV